MILCVMSTGDPIHRPFLTELTRLARGVALVDEASPYRYEVSTGSPRDSVQVRIRGGGCTGCRPATAAFLRHSVTANLRPGDALRGYELQKQLDSALQSSQINIVNPPWKADSNYSKMYQVDRLRQFGFEVPDSLLTNDPAAALDFYEQNDGCVIYKGASNVPTFARLLTQDHLRRLRLLPNSPTLFQQFIEGVDYRVHVVDDRVFATRIAGGDGDYRRSLLHRDGGVVMEPAEIPTTIERLCIDATDRLGLVVSGLDFRVTPDDKFVALELNPYPQFTFYDRAGGPSVSQAIAEYLVAQDPDGSAVYV